MKNFIHRIRQTIQTNALIAPGDTILAGVSGGADSIALLEVLDGLRASWGLKVIVGHINHGLRKGADADQRFVETVCRRKQIPCHSVRVRIPLRQGDSLEQAARRKRFDALIRLARRCEADAIALGHHQDDLTETVLMRILRGSGLQGLQAILPKRTMEKTVFIRPLLETTRAEIEAFLKNKKIHFRTDPTNSDTKFLRNKVRRKLLPLLQKEYNPQIVAVLAGLAETAALDYDFLSGRGQAAFQRVTTRAAKGRIELSVPKLKQLHPALRRLVIRQAIERVRGDTRTITLAHLRAIEAFLNDAGTPDGAQIHLPRKIRVTKHKGTLTLRHT